MYLHKTTKTVKNGFHEIFKENQKTYISLVIVISHIRLININSFHENSNNELGSKHFENGDIQFHHQHYCCPDIMLVFVIYEEV